MFIFLSAPKILAYLFGSHLDLLNQDE